MTSHALLARLRPTRTRLACALVVTLAVAACGHRSSTDASGEGAAPAEAETEPGPGGGAADPGAVADELDDAGVLSPAAAVDAGVSHACPADMRLVEGDYCPAVQERCAARKQLDPRSVPEKNNCQTYVEPTVCLVSKRTPMRYCMDTYEWPNRKGELPRVLVSWESARDLCASRGKRLCTEPEFTFACEGEAMRPYVYGFERDPGRCNIDRTYRPRTFTFTPWDSCMGDDACKAAFADIDQRWPAGSNDGCRSPEGVYDLNGNVNEWVSIPGAKSPRRSGLKGGWWGPVRNRCRPTVRFHDEGDYGYEVGFRCCADAGD
jgi:hypothetical protein